MLTEKILKLIALVFCLNFTGNLLYILGAIHTILGRRLKHCKPVLDSFVWILVSGIIECYHSLVVCSWMLSLWSKQDSSNMQWLIKVRVVNLWITRDLWWNTSQESNNSPLNWEHIVRLITRVTPSYYCMCKVRRKIRYTVEPL